MSKVLLTLHDTLLDLGFNSWEFAIDHVSVKLLESDEKSGEAHAVAWKLVPRICVEKPALNSLHLRPFTALLPFTAVSDNVVSKVQPVLLPVHEVHNGVFGAFVEKVRLGETSGKVSNTPGEVTNWLAAQNNGPE